MKCIILAGGSGNRLWPLSRKNYPKQFLDFGNNTSIFQETITRNIPFCDAFYIITNEAYQSIVEGQMQQFQGIDYHIFLEEEGRGTAPAIYLCSLLIGDEEDVFILPSDVVIEGENYSDCIYHGKDLAESGQIVLFGTMPTSSTTSYGYIRFREEKVTRFIEKPSSELAEQLFAQDDTYWNSGMILAKNKVLQEEMKQYASLLCRNLKPVSDQGRQVSPNTIRYGKELFSGIENVSIDKCLLEQTDRMSVV
nr:mannose-1-phosphate guanylyltransferase [Lachnospiraceae bacterium]